MIMPLPRFHKGSLIISPPECHCEIMGLVLAARSGAGTFYYDICWLLRRGWNKLDVETGIGEYNLGLFHEI